jgi:hypothetical protein
MRSELEKGGTVMADNEGKIWVVTNFQGEWQIQRVGEEYFHRRLGEQAWQPGKPKGLESWCEP